MLDNFDPRPLEFRGNVTNRLPTFLEKFQDERLGISLLLDIRFYYHSFEQDGQQPTSSPSIPSTTSLQETVKTFILCSFCVSPDKAGD